MQPEDNEIYGTYTSPYQPVSPAPVGVLEPPPITDTPSEQGIVESPGSPAGPSSPPPIPPRKRRRPGPAGAIVLLALIGLIVYYAVEVVERLAIPWHVSQQASAKDATL